MSPPHARSRPRPQATIADRLDRLVPRIDALVRDSRLGHPLTERAYAALEEEAQAIADELRATFRGPTPKPVNPPLWQAPGKALW